MLSPQELIGQKVWLEVQNDLSYLDQVYKVKAEITQPTSPPWFFARYLDSPFSLPTSGQWMSLYEAQQAVLQAPVIEPEDSEDFDEDEFDIPEKGWFAS